MFSRQDDVAAQWAAHIDNQMIELPNSQREGFSSIYRNAAFPDNPPSMDGYTAFIRSVARAPDAPCLGHRPFDEAKNDFADHFQWRTYQQVSEEATALGSTMCSWVEQGLLKAHSNDRGIKDPGMTSWTVAYWGPNSCENLITSLATAAFSRVTVGLYDNYDAAMSCYILQHSQARVLVCPSRYVPVILRNADKLPALRVIVIVDRPGPRPAPFELAKEDLMREWAQMHGIHVFNYTDVVAEGREAMRSHIRLEYDNLECLCYTSGTTGLPKASRITKSNISEALTGLDLVVPRFNMVAISYLPLAHVLERGWELFMLFRGGAIGYYSGSVERLSEDMQLLKPTVLASVPRVLNRVAGQIQMQMNQPGLKGKLLTKAVETKLANYEANGQVTHWLWDRLVFRKVRSLLGGQIQFVFTGSAPCRADVLKLLRVSLCCDVREAYGQTENCAYATFMAPNDLRLGSVGPANPGLDLRLRSCPELGYNVTDKPCPRGEIMFRGSSVFSGYEGDEKKTQETLMEDEKGEGYWLMTGDVGMIDQWGRLRIIDRVKNLIKLAQGEYIAIEKVEGIFASMPLCQQVWLYGDSFQPHLVAIAVPEPSLFAPFASQIMGKKIDQDNAQALEEACGDKRVVDAVLRAYVALGKHEGLGTLEQMRALKLRVEPFSPENGLMTPTLKIKRQEAAKIFKEELDALYKQQPIDLNSIQASKL